MLRATSRTSSALPAAFREALANIIAGGAALLQALLKGGAQTRSLGLLRALPKPRFNRPT